MRIGKREKQVMILGVNGIRLVGKRSGVGRVIENVLKRMEIVPHPFSKVVVYTPAPLEDSDSYPEFVHFRVLPSRLPPGLWEQWVLLRAHPSEYPLFCPSFVIPLFAKCPILLVHHGSYEGYKDAHLAYSRWGRFKSYWMNRLSSRRATRISTVSEHSKRDMVRFYGIAAEKIEVIHNGVDLKLFRPIRDAQSIAAWKRKVMGADIPFLLYVGKPTRRRNLSQLLRAIADLKTRKIIPHKLLLIGTSQQGTSFESLITTLGLEGEVVTVPYASQDEIALAYNACDIFIYPSSYEGFGMPVLEAMACGAPVIALNNTALPEFAAGVAELLPDAEVDTLANGIVALLANDDRRAEMSRAGPLRASEFDWDIVTRKYIEMLVSLIDLPDNANDQ